MFDAQGQPTWRRRGNYAKLRRTYNEWNQLTAETAYDPQGQLTRHEDGFVTQRFAYDPRGNRIETAFFDENNHPTLHKDGYTKVLSKYNDKGQRVERAFVGLDGAYVLDKKTGSAKERLSYNERGQVAERMYFDPDERLVQTVDGYATMRYTYDDLGRETRRAFFDVNGVPVYTRVTIRKFEPGSNGQQRGLEVGDVFLSYDGEDVSNEHAFKELELVRGERRRDLRILRQGQVMSLTVDSGRLQGLDLVDRVPSTAHNTDSPGGTPLLSGAEALSGQAAPR
jgi:YD repeat-containing protein